MPSSYTTSLRLTLPATGELAGQWGNTVNTGITELLDAAVAGTTTISTWGGAGVAYTLSNNSGTADEARRMFIVATGTPGEAKNVICPAVSKFYVFRNDTTGGFALTLKTSGGTGIAVPAGQYKFLYCDGTNVVEMFNSAGALTLSGALSVGGTTTLASNPTLSAGTANQVQYLNGSKVLVGSANLTFDGTTLTANALTLTNNPTLSSGTANGVLYLNGSKVATSGSALTFDGTNLGVGGAPTTFGKLDVRNGVNYRVLVNGLAGYGNNAIAGINDAGSETHLGLAGTPIAFYVQASEQMRLTSTGLGIGTSSPAYKLDVAGAIRQQQSVPAGYTTQLLENTNSTGYAQFQFWVGASGANGIASINYAPGLFFAIGPVANDTTTPIVFRNNNATERMRLDTSGNLGIGTSSPGAKLEVYGGAAGTVTNVQVGNASTAFVLGVDGGNNCQIRTAQSVPILFYTAAAERMRLDASGNLGLGVTPSAHLPSGFGGPMFQVGNRASLLGSSVFSTLANNVYYASGFYRYIASDTASMLEQSAGAFRWFTAPSGTAGNAISFTQALTLDASGNLGIGTSSPAYKLVVSNAGAQGFEFDPATGIFQVYNRGTSAYGSMSQYASQIRFFTGSSPVETMRLDSSGNLGLGVTPSATSGSYKNLQNGGAVLMGISGGADTYLNGNATFNSGWKYIYNGFAARYSQNDVAGGVHAWFTAPSGTAGTAISFTQAMTLDASGNLQLGATSGSGNRLNVVGTGGIRVNEDGASTKVITIRSDFAGVDPSVMVTSNHALLLGTNNTERARITSGGDFGIGNTNPLYRLTVDKDTTSALAFFTNSNASAPNGLYVDFSASSPNNATQYFLYCEDSTAQRATIRSNGGIANYSGNDVNLSDRREKTNFAPAKSYLDTICAIPVQTFEYIDQSPDDPGLTLGVVAQDVQAVAPELVMESNWGTADEPKMRLSIYQTDLQYALMKCIQEQQALITALTARVAALEAQP